MGALIPFGGGEVYSVSVSGITKAEKGSAGELRGRLSEERVGTVNSNRITGVFGTLDSFENKTELIPLAKRGEVKTGDCTVITTLEISGSVLYRAISNVGEEERCAIISSTAGAQIILSLIFSIIYIIFRIFFYAIVPLSLTLSLILIAQVCINSIESIYFIQRR